MSWIAARFSRKLAFAFCAVFLAAGLAGDLLLTRALKKDLVDELESSLLTQARLAGLRLSAASGSAAVRLAVAQSARACACRVTVVAADGRVAADSEVPEAGLPGLENHRTRPEILAALEGRPGVSIRHSATVGADMLYAAVPAAPGVLRLALPLTVVDRKVSRQRGIILTISLITLGASLLVALALARSISRPVEEMSLMAARLAEGRYDERLRLLPPDELGRLGAGLNALAERIAATILELSKEKSQVSAVLASMVEGVVAVDANGRVLLLNPALAELLRIDAAAARGKPFVEALRQSQVGRFLEEALKDGEAREGEARIFVPEERVFEVHALPLRDGGSKTGAIAVLHDVTRLRRLEAVRRDFVGNVSHEFRTPLASIRAFAEALQSGAVDDKENRMDFLQTIIVEADRMSRLVDDLLELSAIESGSRPLQLEPVDPLAVAREVAESLRPLAERGKVRLEVAAGEPAFALADKAQLRQVFVNLVGNAIKFNREGGSVSVSSRREGESLLVSVEDTGIGIPQADLPRLFERFYRVDKARSRELGGTGLGLAIVKHAVEAHGGSVSVESREDEGTTFRFSLPLAQLPA